MLKSLQSNRMGVYKPKSSESLKTDFRDPRSSYRGRLMCLSMSGVSLNETVSERSKKHSNRRIHHPPSLNCFCNSNTSHVASDLGFGRSEPHPVLLKDLQAALVRSHGRGRSVHVAHRSVPRQPVSTFMDVGAPVKALMCPFPCPTIAPSHTHLPGLDVYRFTKAFTKFRFFMVCSFFPEMFREC